MCGRRALQKYECTILLRDSLLLTTIFPAVGLPTLGKNTFGE
jgi:hypothetical protein